MLIRLTLLIFFTLIITVEATTWEDVYYTLRTYESKEGTVMVSSDRKHWGYIHIGVSVMRDYNKRNRYNKVRYDDLFTDEQKCFDVMRDHMIHYGNAYRKYHKKEPTMLFYYSLWGKGYEFTVENGISNRYSRKLLNLLKSRLKAQESIVKSQEQLYKDLKALKRE